jgi:hypothetical protein
MHHCGYLCAMYGCQRTAPCTPTPFISTPIISAPQGCICPPESEKTCRGPLCPRRSPKEKE